jgi:hypothetical protein
MMRLGKPARMCDEEYGSRGRGSDEKYVAHSGWCGLKGTRRSI